MTCLFITTNFSNYANCSYWHFIDFRSDQSLKDDLPMHYFGSKT